MDLNTNENYQKERAAGIPMADPAESLHGYVQLAKSSAFKPTDRFAAKLGETLGPGLTAKDLIGRIVMAALESEFGHAFTRSKGFDKIVSTISDSIVANPDLRRQSLAIASQYMTKGVKVTGAARSEKEGKDDKKS